MTDNTNTMRVWRGGANPGDAEEMAERLEYYSPIVCCHADKFIAERYGSVGRRGYLIDVDKFLDARVEPGASLWAKLQHIGTDDDVAAELRRLGYAGVIYPDPHNWDDVDPEDLGPEVAIVDPSGIIWEA